MWTLFITFLRNVSLGLHSSTLFTATAVGTSRETAVQSAVSHNMFTFLPIHFQHTKKRAEEIDSHLTKAKQNKKFWEELIAYFPLILHAPQEYEKIRGDRHTGSKVIS
jgi:hypothetical protein